MPKTNDGGGATYAGNEGIVEHADGRRSELDPSRNLDGTAVDGYDSDERSISEPGKDERESRERAAADPTEVRPLGDATEDEEHDEKEEAPSAGTSSSTSSESSNRMSAKRQTRR